MIAPTKEEVYEARYASRLTQKAAAALIGATERAWQEWEGGRRNMPAAKYKLFLILIADTRVDD